MSSTSKQVDNDSYYFRGYAHWGVHETMLTDTVRTGGYERAICDNAAYFKDKVCVLCRRSCLFVSFSFSCFVFCFCLHFVSFACLSVCLSVILLVCFRFLLCCAFCLFIFLFASGSAVFECSRSGDSSTVCTTRLLRCVQVRWVYCEHRRQWQPAHSRSVVQAAGTSYT